MIRDRSDAPWFAVAAVCVGAFMGQLDASIVTVALPTLQRTFDASVGAVTWVGLSYLLVLVATVTAVGRFADMWGRKLLYVYGFVIFTLASVLCGLAPDLGALCVFRAFQAVGAAMLQANSLAIIVLVVEEKALGKAIGLQGAAQALGLALGPTVGGLLLAAGGWRLIFFVNVPFGIFGAVAAILLVPRSRNLLARVAFDWTGLAVFFPAVVALLSAISFGAELGWSSAAVVVLFCVAAVLFVVFVRHERRDKEPMLDLGLFRSGQFSTGIASGLLSYLVMFGVLLLVPFYFERGPWSRHRAIGARAHGDAPGLWHRGPSGRTLCRQIGGPPAHGLRHGTRHGGTRRDGLDSALDGPVPPPPGHDRRGHGPLHLTEQRIHHGCGPGAERGNGLGRPQHDARHGDGTWPCPDRVHLHRGRRFRRLDGAGGSRILGDRFRTGC